MGQGAGPAFLSVDALLAEVRRLAQAYPDRAALSVYGASRAGEPLYALRVGDGLRRILAYAFPQPDEPLGGLVACHLARRLLEEEGLVRGATWLFLPCVDPDGARRNEGWFTRPPDLATYARCHFRPPEGEQVEWAFPSDDPSWPWDRPLPETRALQALIDSFRPQVLFPLHNALLGGAYAYLSPEAAPLAAKLPQFWEARGLPTHRGEAELPFARALAPGVQALPDLEEIAAALRGPAIPDPAGLLACGAPAYLYVRRYGHVLTVVPELPLFTVAGIADTGPSVLPYSAVLQVALADARKVFALWSALHRRAFRFLREDNPYRSALTAYRCTTPFFLQALATWLEENAGLERLATVAEALDGLEVAAYWRLLPLGMLQQALAWEGRPEAGRLRDEVAARLEEGLAEVLPALPAAAVPLAVLVETASEILLAAVGADAA